MVAKLLPLLSMLALILLTGCHVPGHSSDWGSPQRTTERTKKEQSCAPQVAFWKPGRGSVVDVKTCTSSFFGVTDERTYVRIRATWPTKETVWVVDTEGRCDVGDRWDVFEPQGPARCEG